MCRSAAAEDDPREQQHEPDQGPIPGEAPRHAVRRVFGDVPVADVIFGRAEVVFVEWLHGSQLWAVVVVVMRSSSATDGPELVYETARARSVVESVRLGSIKVTCRDINSKEMTLVDTVASAVAVLAAGSTMYMLTFVVVGLVAGVLASIVMRRSGAGVLRYIVIGIAGAFAGGWVFGELGWNAPFSGIGRVTATAFVGAAAALWFSWFLTSAIRAPR